MKPSAIELKKEYLENYIYTTQEYIYNRKVV
jgi:hypothetical protein